MVLELARPSEARCFPPASDFFEAVLLQQPQATEAVEKGCFSRISEDSLGTFSGPFRAGPRKPPHCGVSLMFESLRDQKNTVNTAVFGASQAKKHGIYEVL